MAIDYKVTPEALLYVSASEGKKPGGISLVNGAFSPTTNTYLPEKMWAYEVGAKTEWLDKRLLINVAGFYQDYTTSSCPAHRSIRLRSFLSATPATPARLTFTAWNSKATSRSPNT